MAKHRTEMQRDTKTKDTDTVTVRYRHRIYRCEIQAGDPKKCTPGEGFVAFLYLSLLLFIVLLEIPYHFHI